jgi:hypothetical protein
MARTKTKTGRPCLALANRPRLRIVAFSRLLVVRLPANNNNNSSGTHARHVFFLICDMSGALSLSLFADLVSWSCWLSLGHVAAFLWASRRRHAPPSRVNATCCIRANNSKGSPTAQKHFRSPVPVCLGAVLDILYQQARQHQAALATLCTGDAPPESGGTIKSASRSSSSNNTRAEQQRAPALLRCHSPFRLPTWRPVLKSVFSLALALVQDNIPRRRTRLALAFTAALNHDRLVFGAGLCVLSPSLQSALSRAHRSAAQWNRSASVPPMTLPSKP